MKITLTPDDMLKGEPFKNGWYKAQIESTVSKPSKDSGSINHIISYRLENDPDNRTLDGNFNSKAIGFIKPFLAALEGIPLAEFIEKTKKTGLTFDLDEVKGKKLQIKIENELFEGRMVSKVKDYAPYDMQIPF